MYALHPGSLPPHGPRAKERLEVSADDLMALYGISPDECIVWNPADGYDHFDFIHLYPSYYDRYTLRPDGTPDKDVPCGPSSTFSGVPTAGKASPSSRAATSMRGGKTSR